MLNIHLSFENTIHWTDLDFFFKNILLFVILRIYETITAGYQKYEIPSFFHFLFFPCVFSNVPDEKIKKIKDLFTGSMI